MRSADDAREEAGRSARSIHRGDSGPFRGLPFAAWHLIRPGPMVVDPGALPDAFPVLAFWRDGEGQEHCRPFFHNELTQHLAEVGNVSFTVSEDQEASCRKSFQNGWSERFPWERIHGSRPYFEVVRRDGSRHEVHVSFLLDTDAPNDSWYTTYEGSASIEDARYWHYVGPGLGLAAVTVALPSALLTYVVCAAIWVFRGKHR